MNKFRNPYLATILSFLVLFISCSDDNTNPNEELKFNYSTFETYKNLNLNIEIPSSISSMNNSISRYERTLDIINKELGSNLSLSVLDNQILTNDFSKKSINYNYNDFLNDIDLELLENFENDLVNNDLTIAINNFEDRVYTLNLNESEFGKYNAFINVVLLLENEMPGIFTTSNLAKGPCEEAIASYSLATLGLAACGATGPAAPLFCGAAIAAKILAFRAMVRDCGDQQ